jgi:tRNA (guanosine-2'-O-)-methyltransferase
VLAAAVPGGQVSLAEIDVTRPTALVFGNEHAGLTAAAVAQCDLTFGIPMQGFTQSFNLSVSVAISVYECARRRRAAGAFGLTDAEKLKLRARWYALSADARAVMGIVDRHVSERTRGSVGD